MQRFPYNSQIVGQGEKKKERCQSKERKKGKSTHQFDKVLIGLYRWMDVKHGVIGGDPERQPDALLDLLVAELPWSDTVPSRDAPRTISSKLRAHRISGSTLRVWNTAMTPAPVTPTFTKRLTA